MTDSVDHLRIELTILDPKLFRAKAEWWNGDPPRLLFCTPFEHAVKPPFPAEGKKGISIWVGPLAAFKEPKARLLWEVEKRRKRATLVVLTSQKGRSFLRSYREMGTLLGDTTLAPLSFLRRRGQEWDSLDFFSPGDSSFMVGANPRLKRLKQAGWEYLVDRVAMADPAVKSSYYDSLHVEREVLLSSVSAGARQLKLSPLVGVAGECLTQETLFSLFEEPLLRGLIDQLDGQPSAMDENWLLVAKREAGQELLLFGRQGDRVAVGDIFRGAAVVAKGGRGEFAVAEILQRMRAGEDDWLFRLRVDWRYPPEREIPTLWKQKNVPSAGSD